MAALWSSLHTFEVKRNKETGQVTVHSLFPATACTPGMEMQILDELRGKNRSITVGEEKIEYFICPTLATYLLEGDRVYVRQYEGGREMEITSKKQANEGVLRRQDWRKRQEALRNVIQEQQENRLNCLPEDVLLRILNYVTYTKIMIIRGDIIMNFTIECD